MKQNHIILLALAMIFIPLIIISFMAHILFGFPVAGISILIILGIIDSFDLLDRKKNNKK